MSIYKEQSDRSGKSIVDCFVEDWAIFHGRERLTCLKLLSDITGDAGLGSKYFASATLTEQSPKDKWINFRAELVSKYRFFPDNQPDKEYLPILFNHLKEDVQGNIYRARIQDGTNRFKKNEMGMPPPQNTRGGRANPVGIPYFYAASHVDTAIAETRPHPGNNVSVAKFEVVHALKVVNLINPREVISPFKVAYEQGDEDYLKKLRFDVEFLCHLGAELSTPITPDVAELEYLPTQYLCELIKRAGFDGVKFKSSVGNGVNYALFNQSKVRAVSVSSYRIDNLQYGAIKNKRTQRPLISTEPPL